MRRRPPVLTTLSLCFLLGACAPNYKSAATPPSDSLHPQGLLTISLDSPVHFMGTEGNDEVLEAGTYRIDPAHDHRLRVLSEKDQPTLLAATPATHDIDLATPFALAYAEQNDQLHLLLLFPDGHALDTVGSSSGIRTRDTARMHRHYQFVAESGTAKFGEGTSGRRPPSAQSAVSSAYREGMGSTGNVGAGGELQMIQLQSVISQRQTALALTTAIVNAQNERFHLEYGMNRPGADYAQRMEASPEGCRTSCSGDQTCQAFTFVKAPTGMANGQCFLKRAVPAPVAAPCCISGKRKSAQEEIIGNIR